MHQKRFVILAILLIASLLLAACPQPEPVAPAAPETGAGEETEGQAEAPAEAAVQQGGVLAASQDTASDATAACRAFWSLFIRGYFADRAAPTGRTQMRGDVCDAPPSALRNSSLVGAATLGPLGDWDWREDFRGIHVPVLVIHGEEDPIPAASASEWRAAFPEAELVLVEESGHFPPIDARERWAARFFGFLESV